MATLIRAAALTNYFEVAQQLGINPQPLLAKAGLSRSQIAEPEQRVPAAKILSLLEYSAAESHCLTFGLRMAESRQLADFGAISLLLSHQRTLRDALNAVVQYEHILNESLAISVEDAGRSVIIRSEVVTDPPVSSRQGTELAIGALYRLCSALLGAHWHSESVYFSHEAPEDLRVHRRVFRCKTIFNAEFNAIICPAENLDYPNPTSDPMLAKFAENYVKSLGKSTEHSVVQDARKAIVLFLPLGRASIEQVAESLGLNVRTLQRRLEESDLVFSDLLNDVRRELVLRYIENSEYSLGHIGELLGYAVPSSFTRWFSSQFGCSPTHWRSTNLKRIR